ncbi:MAG: hypothetical protein M3478_10680 [Planctomycetota bacterium]|nr:hypothetical protein [Planctomycetota bacterium]
MRLILKLSAILLLGVLAQCAIARCANELDGAAFVARVFVAQVRGAPADDYDLVIEASRLLERQCERRHVVVEKYWHDEDVQLASGDDI